MDYESLLAFEDAGDDHTAADVVRELLEAGMSVAEVAGRLGVARNTVKQAAFRLRNRGVTPRGVR